MGQKVIPKGEREGEGERESDIEEEIEEGRSREGVEDITLHGKEVLVKKERQKERKSTTFVFCSTALLPSLVLLPSSARLTVLCVETV